MKYVIDLRGIFGVVESIGEPSGSRFCPLMQRDRDSARSERYQKRRVRVTMNLRGRVSIALDNQVA